MRFVDERTFHLTMGGIFVTALLLENAAARYLPTWDPPTIGFVSFVVGLAWIGRYAAWRGELAAERERVAAARLDRLERLVATLEDELRARHRDPLGRTD